MKKKCLVFVCLAFITCLYSPGLQAQIVALDSLASALSLADADTLVIYDLDQTLIVPTKEARTKYPYKHYEKMVQEYMRKRNLTREEASPIAWQDYQTLAAAIAYKTVEPETVSIVEQAQSLGIKTLGLTGREPGIAERTILHLQGLGINLSKSSIYSSELTLARGEEKVGITTTGDLARFLGGILFVGQGNNKGTALFKLLDTINYKPKRILFIDDLPRYLSQVELAAKAHGIPFLGVQYNHTPPSDNCVTLVSLTRVR